MPSLLRQSLPIHDATVELDLNEHNRLNFQHNYIFERRRSGYDRFSIEDDFYRNQQQPEQELRP